MRRRPTDARGRWEMERGTTTDAREMRERVGSGGEWGFSAPHPQCKNGGTVGALPRRSRALATCLECSADYRGERSGGSAAKGSLSY